MYTVPKLHDYSATALQQAADDLLRALEEESRAVAGEADRTRFRNRWLGRKSGILTQVNDGWLKAAPREAKREAGQRLNELKAAVEARVEALLTAPITGTPATQLSGDAGSANSAVDITLPGTRRPLGAEHPVIRTMNEIVAVFAAMGYSTGAGPEIENDYYNFEALNFPPNHPARDTQDTFLVAGQEHLARRERRLLRTHTSPGQIRTMEKQQPPVRMVIPGKVHRHDTADASHSPVFHQVEGLAVDKNITFCDLKGTLDHAMKALFGSRVRTRFHPSFFPFTEPSADVQISCIVCDGSGRRGSEPCRLCKQTGWVELLGCGMVHPAVYGFVNYDPAVISGFAFGMGVERVALMKYGIDDIQLLFQGDVRFLRQFA